MSLIYWSIITDRCMLRSVILFDGALPNTKKEERLRRMRQNIQQMSKFRSPFNSSECALPRQIGSTLYPLLAPALKERLSKSKYEQVTVPGEADDWCAACANESRRSIVFTNDTDLMLYEYSQEPYIIFFRDLDLSLPNFNINWIYSPTKIRNRLKLNSLISLAYAIYKNPTRSFSENIHQAKSVDLDSTQYLGFSRRYTSLRKLTEANEQFRPAALRITLQSLDVRVSELVHQALAPGSLVPDVYLPLFFEDCNQASAWIQKDVRLLAYSLVVSPSVKIICEYTRKGQSLKATELQVPSQKQLMVSATEITSIVQRRFKYEQVRQEAASSSAGIARRDSILLAVQLALREIKAPHTSLLSRVLDDHFDNTWSFIQLQATLQATLYSLRLLEQSTSVWLALNGECSNFHSTIEQLHSGLSEMPGITDLFSVPGQRLRRLGDGASTRKAIKDLYASAGVHDATLFEEPKSKSQKKREKRARKSQQCQTNEIPQQSGNNPFSLLN
ncbi:hypothetical protein EJ04DRAFT_222238 [Polyplosphaeria fusca]|uniref:Asteroid domain-containing protein n=1 Tax=Polyplosphaeria fusca TaxID=682080 RepID=A0A9P4QW67_9PLEO|nr:hypothetical protein EJ04DRAFT_222238 [Polyplosphaeria fusca]